ncbi:MAG: hypothetical protein JXR76_17120 [Deltaproteobacteria bacterium]|nr:hypothetical protein [Deltaproteobacteria bacterium]
MKIKRLMWLFTAMTIGMISCLLFFVKVSGAQHFHDGAVDSVRQSITRTEVQEHRPKYRRGHFKSGRPFIVMPSPHSEDATDMDDRTEDRTTPEQRARLAAMYAAVGDDYILHAPEAFDEVMEEEPIDHMWSGIVNAALKKGFESGAFAGSTFRDAECHSTICRIRVTYKDRIAMSQFWSETGKEEALVGPSTGFSRYGENGAIESTIYMGKYAQDYQFEKNALDRLYEMVTGQSADGVVPTEKQIAAQTATTTEG